MSDETADRLELTDDLALCGAIARNAAKSTEPVLVRLPSFGGDGSSRSIDPTSNLRLLGVQVLSRATVSNPIYDDDAREDEDADFAREALAEFWGERESYHRWFIRERAPRLNWLDRLRTAFARELARISIDNCDAAPRPALKAARYRALTVIRNNDGGRSGSVKRAVRVPHGSKSSNPDASDVAVLVLATEFDRPSAVAALADVGIHLVVDPVAGWLNASVEPGQHGWLDVIWRGAISGQFVEPTLAVFHIDSAVLTVFADELRDPVEKLLRRVGFAPQEVRIDSHRGDPAEFFGIDAAKMNDLMEVAPTGPWTLEAPGLTKAEFRPRSQYGEFEFEVARHRARHRPWRKLRSQARALLPVEWAAELEAVWSPDDATSSRVGPTATTGPGRPTEVEQREAREHPAQQPLSCRLCDGSVEVRRSDEELQPYCDDCCNDAREGLFFDRGFDGDWCDAVSWSLKVLAEIEFGGPPAKEQLAQLPPVGAQSDLLMLCRMLTARSHMTVLGSARKSYSWTDWLAKAGLLTNGFRTSRGVTVTAKDGHICRSLLERQIDDFFYDNGIEHEVEPHYPYDPEINITGYRADWKLSDGTFVEALGFPNDAAYMAKADRKITLARKHQIRLVTVTHADTANLARIFEAWVRPEFIRTETALPPRLEVTSTSAPNPVGGVQRNGKNATNDRARAERLARCREAVQLQIGGATRRQISAQLGVSEDVVAGLLRDGKFYANPNTDPTRLAAARQAADAQEGGRTRAEFRAQMKLSNTKANECWRDADVLAAEACRLRST